MGGGSGPKNAFQYTIGYRQSATIHQGRQSKHVQGSPNYQQEVALGKHPSIVTESPDILLREGAGSGRMIGNREILDYGRIIGKSYDLKTSQYVDTTRAAIHYDTMGHAHIVPILPLRK